MPYQSSFERYEKKYLLSERQYLDIRALLRERTMPDEYGKHTVSSIYYDTSDRYLIRYSLEHPPFKEKFRLRRYGAPSEPSPVYAEIKKKFKGIVYKRRVSCSEDEIPFLLTGGFLPEREVQIQREIHHVFTMYELSPSALIACEREALIGTADRDLRITFDSELRGRSVNGIDFTCDRGDDILRFHTGKKYVMEIKFPAASPLWLCRILSETGILPQSFSKYGTWYLSLLSGH